MKRDREDEEEEDENHKRAKLDDVLWEAYYDDNERKYYYYNTETQETTWQKPSTTSIDYVDEIPEEEEKEEEDEVEISQSMSISNVSDEKQQQEESSSSSSEDDENEDDENDEVDEKPKILLQIHPDQTDAILEPTFKDSSVINFQGRPASIRLLSSWLDTATASKKSSENVIVESMCNKIRQKFSAEKLEHLLHSTSPPVWIEDLTSVDFSSQLLLDLSSVHSKSLILNYAVRRVLEKKETSSNTRLKGAESTVGTFFNTFAKVLKDLLLNLVRSENAQEYENILSSIVSVASNDLHTYMYTVAVLDRLVTREEELSTSKSSSWWRGVRERLQRNALDGGKFVTLDATMTRLYATTNPKLVKHSANILKRGHSESSEIAEIRILLEQNQEKESNNLDPLRDTIVYLIKQIMNPFRRLGAKHREDICWIVALVSSSSNNLYETLCTLSNLCNNQLTIHETKGSSELILSTVLPLIDTPVSCLCMLSWIDQVWFSSRTSNNRFVQVKCVDIFLEILLTVIEKRTQHHHYVFEILTKSLTYETKIKRENLMKVRRRTMSRMIYALTLPSYSSRFATRTLNFISSRTEKFDRSELRYFAIRLSTVMTGTGISADIARAVVRLFDDKNVKKSLTLSDSESARVQNLLSLCRQFSV